MISYQEKTLVIDQLFTTQKHYNQQRLNYLLISIFKQIFPIEFARRVRLMENEGVNSDEVPWIFTDSDQYPKMISHYIFLKIYDSQTQNKDTVRCLVAHIVSKIMMEFVNSNGLVDHSIDVTDFQADWVM